MRKKSSIGIDLGTDSVKIVALESVNGEAMPRVVGVGAAQSPSLTIRKGVVIDPENLAPAIKEAKDLLEKSAGIRDFRAHVAIGGNGLAFQKTRGLIAVSRADGEITKEDVKRAISAAETALSRMQNREILHKIPLTYTVDGEEPVYDPVGLTGNKLEAEVFFITIPTQNLKNALMALEEAGVEVEELVAGPLAAAGAVLKNRDKEMGAMILDLGASVASLMIFEYGLPYSLDIINVGFQNISQDIDMMLKIDFDEAEKLKINYGAVGSDAENFSKKSSKNASGVEDFIYGHYSKKKLSDIIKARISDIFELVEKHLKRVERTKLLAGGIVLVGGGANLPGIESFTKEVLDLPARVAEPENLGGFKDKIKNPAWASAVGAALMAFEKEPPFAPHSGSSMLRWLRAFLP